MESEVFAIGCFGNFCYWLLCYCKTFLVKDIYPPLPGSQSSQFKTMENSPIVSDKVFEPTELNKSNIFLHCTLYLSFRSTELYHQYESYQRERSSFIFLFVSNIFVSVFCILSSKFLVDFELSVFSILQMISTIFALLSGASLMIVNAPAFCKCISFTQDTERGRLISYLESIWIFSACLVGIILLLIKVVNGKCENGSELLLSNLTCEEEPADQHFPKEYALFSLFLPLVLSLVAKGAKWEIVLSAWIISALNIVVIITAFDMRVLLPALVFALTFSFVALYESQRQNVILFLTDRRLQLLSQENKDMSTEIQANQLRHMIGNVAHDLKTPLTGFMSGIDIINSVVPEILTLLDDAVASMNESAFSSNASSTMFGSNQFAGAREGLAVILQSTNNIKSINNFMLMTINRCIDYTKASRGLKLVPMFETVDLKDTLTLPVFCMKEMQSRVKVLLQPLPSDICSHIITDKQWLQENVLCLLSNAVKYSSKGTVIISVFLVDSDRRTEYAARTEGEQQQQQGDHAVSSSVAATAAAGVLPLLISSPTASCSSLQQRQSYDSNDSADHLVVDFIERGLSCCSSNDDDDGSLRSSRNARSGSGSKFDGHQQVPSSGQQQQQYLKFEVTDTGIGLSQEAMNNLFSPFKQAQRMAGGTGLGLFSLAKRVEALQGQYGVHRRVDAKQGSVFWFTIPYRPDRQLNSRSNSMLERSRSNDSCSSVATGVGVEQQPDQYRDRDVFHRHHQHTSLSTTTAAAGGGRLGGFRGLSVCTSSYDNTTTTTMTAATTTTTEGVCDDYASMIVLPTASTSSTSTVTTPMFSQQQQQQYQRYHYYNSRLPTQQLQQQQTNKNKLEDNLIRLNSFESFDTLVNSNSSSSKQPQQQLSSDCTIEEKLNILLVDDSITIQKMSGMMLRRKGHKVTFAENGLDGLEKALEQWNTGNPYDLVLMDFQMPVMDGLEATRRLRNAEKVDGTSAITISPSTNRILMSSSTNAVVSGKHSPVMTTAAASVGPELASPTSIQSQYGGRGYRHIIIGLSANSDQEVSEAGYAAGIDAFIPKPFTLQTFQHTYKKTVVARKQLHLHQSTGCSD